MADASFDGVTTRGSASTTVVRFSCSASRTNGETGTETEETTKEVVAIKAVAAAGAAIPCYTGLRFRGLDAIVAEQEAAGPCRQTRRRKATARQLHLRGYRHQCGFASSTSRDGGSLSKLIRTPARPLDARS